MPGETYVKSPDYSLIRVVMALSVILDWKNVVWDIKTFYLHADRDKCLRIPLRMAKGFRERDANGEEFLGCLERVLYGAANAGFVAQRTLTDWIQSTFNEDGISLRFPPVAAPRLPHHRWPQAIAAGCMPVCSAIAD